MADLRLAYGECATPHEPANGLERLFTTHSPALYRLARRMVVDAETASDLVQDTFVRAASAHLPSDRQGEEAWLVRVLVNLCRDRWRKEKVRRRFQEKRASEEGAAEPRATGASSEAAVTTKIALWEAMRLLHPRRRAIVVLCELNELSPNDVGEILHLSAITVRWHLQRARRELARTMGV